MDFLNKNVEDFHKSNEGLIWFIGLILATLIAWRTYANGVYQSELKKCALLNKEKNDQIAIQNGQIIKNQETYIKELRYLNDHINKNTEKDLKTLALIQKQGIAIENLNNRIVKSEIKLNHFTKINNRLTSIERLLKIHDKEIEILKA